MFEGSSVSEQLHQFLTPRTTPNSSSSSSLIPLNFALHSPNFNFHHPFDSSSYNSTTTSTHLLHQSSNPVLHDHKKNDDTTTSNLQVAMELEIGRENNSNNNNNRSAILMEDHHHHHQWSNDELLALLRVRSNIDNCFPESTWEHVSRKLGEVGFRRTAEKCKEKFEEESRYFNHINYNKSCKFFLTDHHELNYHHHQDQAHGLLLIHERNEKHDDDDGGPTVVAVPEEAKEQNEQASFRDRDKDENNVLEEEGLKNETTTKELRQEGSSGRSRSCKKRKRKMVMREKEFEMLKGYCEEIVKKMMTQQEEIHSKLLQDMLKKEEEKVAKEECWKKQQMERLHKELEVMAHEQAIVSDRQTTIIDILNQITNFSSSPNSKKDLQNFLQCLDDNINNNNVPNSPSSSSLIQTQNSSPNKEQQQIDSKNPKNPTQILAPPHQDPNSFINNRSKSPPPFSIQKLPQNPKTRNNNNKDNQLDDLGKRWPRDEVLALVNVRCNLYNTGGGSGSGDHNQDPSGGVDQAATPSKAPLWERISQGMLQLGYKRSAKRCKEKWENINKYFRKTKDVNKKRSIDSRTCPYFHQLSTLYNNQGGGNKPPENCPTVSAENHSDPSENLPISS